MEGYEDNHFICKLLKLDPDKCAAYYNHHSNDYVDKEVALIVLQIHTVRVERILAGDSYSGFLYPRP